MSVVALCYPKVSEEQQRFLNGLRDQYDLAYREVVQPHFTLVFPVSDVSLVELSEHVRRIALGHGPFRFVCRHAMVHDDRANDDWYVFLVPDEGFSRIARLHDELYTEILAPHLRMDRPFLPHIGIATLKNAKACKDLADELNRDRIEVSGTIDTISISAYDGTSVTDRHEVSLISDAG